MSDRLFFPISASICGACAKKLDGHADSDDFSLSYLNPMHRYRDITMTLPVINEFTIGQETQVVSLLRQASRYWAAFNSRPEAFEHWKWKHMDGPLGPSRIALAFAEGAIVGCNHSMPVRLKLGDRFRHVAYATNLAVRPDYRRQGLTRRLIEKSDDLRRTAGAEFYYTITINPVLFRTFQRDYSRFPLELTAFLKVADLPLHLRMKPTKKRLIKFIAYSLLDLKNRLSNRIVRGSPSIRMDAVSDMGRFDNRWDAFWRAASPPFTFIGDRSAEILNWRFNDPRAGVFSTRMTLENGKMTGYIATRTVRRNKDYPEGYIADVLALPGRIDAVEALIRHAVDRFHRSGVNAVHCLIPKRSPYAPVIRRCGFADTRYTEPVYFRSMVVPRMDIQKSGFHSFGKLHFTYSDLDLI